MTTTLPRHVAGLLAAVDAGDDAVIPVLADALEEMNDPRAAGLRQIMTIGIGIIQTAPGGACVWTEGITLGEAAYLLRRQYSGHTTYSTDHTGAWVHFDTRSAAYLALVAALIGETHVN